MAEVENAGAATDQPQVDSKHADDSIATETTTTETSLKAGTTDLKPSNGEDKAEKTTEPIETSDSKKDDKSEDRISRNDRNGRGGRDRNGGGYRNRGGGYSKQRHSSTFDNLPESDDPEEIRKQVEFYFSDANLPQDRYLFEMTQGHKNRSVPIATICHFKRMRHFKPMSAVVKALRESEILEVVTVGNGEEVKRRTPLDESFGTEYDPSRVKVYEDQSMSRSIYAKGFGHEYDSIQTEIEAFFEPYGPFKQIRLRRVDGSGAFKGSVFVEFENDERAKEFLELDPKPTWKDNEEPLKIMAKKAYVESKVDEIRNGDTRPNESNSRRGNFHRDGGHRDGGHRGGRGRGGRGDRGGRRGGRDDRRGGDRRDFRDRDDGKRDRDDWKGRRDDFQGRDKRQRNDEDQSNNDNGEVKPVDVNTEVKAEESSGNGEKRAREEDAGAAAEDRPAKQSKTEGIEA